MSNIDISFLDRRHPEYNGMLPHWAFLKAAYLGGRDWFDTNIFRYHKEGESEFADRKQRAYRFNHTKEVVELVQKYLFKAPVSRSLDGAPETVKKFWKHSTRDGMGIDQLMRMVSTGNAITGRVAVVVDNNFPEPAPVAEGEAKTAPISLAQAEAGNYRVFAYVVSAENILDYAFDEEGDGELLWIKLREIYRDDRDPINSSGEIQTRVRLWTRDNWGLYEEYTEGPKSARSSKRKVRLLASGTHDLGFVPVKLADHVISGEPYRAGGLIDDIAYLDRAVANYLSNLDAIIQDQTFSQLAIPATAILPGDNMFQKVVDLGTKRIFVYDGGSGSTAKPEFLSPDPKQAGVILTVINKIISEIYHTIGLAGERTKQDNAVGIDNSSGVAKAYDFERVNSLLLSKAQSCEQIENWIVKTVQAWNGEAEPADPLVTYPTTFDVTQLSDELVTAEALAKIQAPVELRRQQMRQIVDKIFPQLKKELRDTIAKDIDGWLEGLNPGVPLPPAAPSTGGKPVAAPNRQGEVTAKTADKTNPKPATTTATKGTGK